MVGRRIWAAALLATCVTAGANAATIDLNDTLWGTVGREVGVDPWLAYAVGLVESNRLHDGLNQHVTPWPWTLRWTTPDGQSHARILKSKDEAAQILQLLVKAGITNIDVGWMQVNLGWNWKNSAPEKLLDPEENLRAGMISLKNAMASAPTDVTLGVGRYHSVKNKVAAREYGRAVLVTYKRLLDSGVRGRGD